MQHVGACAWSAWIKEEKLKLNTLLHTLETHKTEKGQKERDLKSDFRVCVRFSSVMKYSVLCLLLEYLKYSWERFEGCCRQPQSCGSVSPACGEVRGPASQCDAHVQKIFKSFLLWFSDEVHLCVVFFFFFICSHTANNQSFITVVPTVLYECCSTVSNNVTITFVDVSLWVRWRHTPKGPHGFEPLYIYFCGKILMFESTTSSQRVFL